MSSESDDHLYGAISRRPFKHLTPDRVRRVQVMNETLKKLDTPAKRQVYHQAAKTNLERWHAAAVPSASPSASTSASTSAAQDGLDLRVVSGDWGDVTQAATQEFGTTFACLNMANERWPGGSYHWGSPAQEENMFRRTDGHFSLLPNMFTDEKRRTEYNPEMNALVAGVNGMVYLDIDSPRVCVRGSENVSVHGVMGGYYKWYDREQVFPFYELRSAAISLRGKVFGKKAPTPKHIESMRKRINSHLDTLISANVRHVILSAFGCGSFCNPPEAVALLYHAAIEERRDCFDVIIFAVYCGQEGTSYNFQVFYDTLMPLSSSTPSSSSTAAAGATGATAGSSVPDPSAVATSASDIEIIDHTN